MAGSYGKTQAQIRAEDRIAAVRNAAGRDSANNRRQNGVPDVYQEMLSEAVSSPEPPPAHREYRPLKKRRLDVSEHDASNADSNTLHARKKPNSITQPAGRPVWKDESESEGQQRPQRTIEDSGQSDDEDMDWEEVDFAQSKIPATSSEHTSPKQKDDDIADISVEVGPKKTAKKTAAKGKPITSVEKLLRLAVHEAHLLFLVFHVHVRNSWCNLDVVRSKLKSFLPLKTIGLLHPREDIIQFSRSENFMNGLKLAVDLWQAKFKIVESGMRRPQWLDTAEDIKQQIGSISDEIRSVDKADFIRRASTLTGSQDVGNQLFCALLRSVGLEARLVCSLQPLPFGTTGVKPGTALKGKRTVFADPHSDGGTSAEEGSASGSASEASITPKGRVRRFGRPGFAIGGSSAPAPVSRATPAKKKSLVRKLEYPVFWVEVFNAAYQRWVPVDATVTGTINKPAKLEPPASYDQNTMSYVLAFEDYGYARDVTKRYTKAFNAKTRKLRIETTETGERWWRKALKPFRQRGRLDRDQVEDAELAKKDAQEGLPNNVQDLKDHPYYALERHLKRHEAIFPKRPVGKINTGKSSGSKVENVFRRSDVQLVRSADKWYRVGREIKPAEQPLKHVPARRSPREREEPDGDAPMTALYAYSQTSLYTAPPVTMGRITKNVFGNLDVYVPSMVPPGATHVRRPLAARAAKLLGIDYADAVTGFKFKGRIGEAVKNGVVIASEYANAVETVIDGFQDAAQEEEDAKRSAESLRLWRRFLTGLRIGVRLGLYEDINVEEMSSKAETVRRELNDAEEKQEESMEAGGFFPDAAEETRPPVARPGATAQPRSLLARAQEEVQHEDTSEEDIQEQAPRLRRQRKMLGEEPDGQEHEEEDGEMDGESQETEDQAPRVRQRSETAQEESEVEQDSEDDFSPEPTRPLPRSRRQGKAKSQYLQSPPPSVRQTGSTRNTKRKIEGSTAERSPVAAAHRGKRRAKVEGQSGTSVVAPALRRSTRVTRSQAKLAEQTTDDDDDDDDVDVDDTNVEIAGRDVNTPRGESPPDVGHKAAEQFGGDFLPEASPDEPASLGQKLLPGKHDAADIGGGFIPSEEAMDANDFEELSYRQNGHGRVQSESATEEADDVEGYGGGFIPEDAEMEGSFGPHPMEHEQVVFTDQPEKQDEVSVAGRSQLPAETTYEEPMNTESGSSVARERSPRVQDELLENQGDSSDDDRGSLLSHDPDDEDAEPEWLNDE